MGVIYDYILGRFRTNDGGGSGGDPNNLGWYATEAALVSAYPTADSGNWAIVGTTDTVWIWDADTVAWLDSGETAMGDVVGPAGATDNAIARYDLATGKLLQNSISTIDDAGNMVVTSINVGGAIIQAQRLVTVASPTAILISDGSILFDTNSNPISITLPLASVGKVIIPFKDIGCNAATNNITINRAGTDTIVDIAVGQTSTVIIADGYSAAFVSNGVDTWHVANISVAGSGSGVPAFVTISTDTILTNADSSLIKVDTSGGNVTLTLPLSSVGIAYDIWKTDALNDVIIARAGADTIIGSTTFTFSGLYEQYSFVPDKSTLWLVK